MIVDNRVIIKNKNEQLYKRLIEVQENSLENVIIEESKKGGPTLIFNSENKAVYVHSKYNPEQEAIMFSDQIIGLEQSEFVLFIGTGLGYHIYYILEKFPHIKYAIFEPNIEILNSFLNFINLDKLKKERLVEVFTNFSEIKNLDKFVDLFVNESVSITWTFTKANFQQEIYNFEEKLRAKLQSKRTSIRVNTQLQERWIVNSIVNFPKVLNTPNILLDIDEVVFKGKPVLLVASGPSLQFDLEKIKQIKQEGRAYIVALGSAINPLIDADIIPDFMTTSDPNLRNKVVLQKLKDAKRMDVPVVFGTSVGYETIIDYKGPLLHMFMSPDRFSRNILNIDNNLVINDAPSIAVMTLQLLIKLGVSKVLLAGQNFAYLDNQKYTSGITYSGANQKVDETKMSNREKVLDVDGNLIQSSEDFILMKNDFEKYLRLNSHLEVINTTKRGASIKGTEYLTLDDAIEKHLSLQGITVDKWYETINSYNKVDALNNLQQFESSFDEMMKYLNLSIDWIGKIMNEYDKGIYVNLIDYMNQFDKPFDCVKSNNFYINIVCPMIKVQNGTFVKRSREVFLEKNPRKKGQLFKEIFVSYVKSILAVVVKIQPAFKEMKIQMHQYKINKVN